MDIRMTEEIETAESSAEASKEAIEAVEAMKAAMTHQDDEVVYIKTGVEWRKTIKELEDQVETELGKANAAVHDILAKEKLKCHAAMQKEFADKEKQMVSEHKEEMKALKETHEKEITDLTKEHEAELDKMKKLYAEQLDETADTFRDKIAALRKEIDQYKNQIETLMLHIDDPFVLQEMQMKQTQDHLKSADETAAETE